MSGIKDFEYDLTINMIVKNEADIIENTLESLRADMLMIKNSGCKVELVIIDGESTDDTVEICKKYADRVITRKFDNFKNQRNFAITVSNGRIIFSIDSDELTSEGLIDHLILYSQIDSYQLLPDVIFVPRVNVVNGITNDYIYNIGWRTDEEGHINYPDYQPRIYKNKDYIRWERDVHETFNLEHLKHGRLDPDKSKKNYLIHIKDIDRQRRQNEFYNTKF